MRMELVVFQLVLFASIPSSTAQLLHNYTGPMVFYFDEFNDSVSFLSLGGYIELPCSAPQGQPRHGNQFEVQVELTSGDRIKVASAPYVANGSQFRMNITEETKFGLYICDLGNNKTVDICITNRMCGDQSSACRNYVGPCTGTDQFCVVTASPSSPTGIATPCDNSALSNCNLQNELDYCKVNATGSTFSYCYVVRRGQFPTTFAEMLGKHGQCPAKENVVMKFAGVVRPLFEYIPINPSHMGSTLDYYCPQGSGAHGTPVVCVIKRSSTDIIFKHDESSCPGVVQVQLQASLFAKGSGIYKAKCEFDLQNGSIIAVLSQFLVVFGGNVNIQVDQVDNITYTLECKLDPPASHKMDVFYTWTSGKTGINTTGSMLNITENDEFVCNVTIVYKSCNPHRLFSYSMVEIITDPITTATTTTMTTSTPPTIQEQTSESTTIEFMTKETLFIIEPRESQYWTWLYILLDVLALLLLIAMIVGLVVNKKRSAAARARAAAARARAAAARTRAAAAKAASMKPQPTTTDHDHPIHFSGDNCRKGRRHFHHRFHFHRPAQWRETVEAGWKDPMTIGNASKSSGKK